MVAAIVALAAALTPLILGVLQLIKEFKQMKLAAEETQRANRDDHARVVAALEQNTQEIGELRIEFKGLDEKFDRHMEWHAHREPVVYPVREVR